MIVRAKRDTNYTIMSNVGMEDARLTFKAKGILAYLLSKPDNWQVRDRQLATVGPDGRAAVQAALRELEKHGYIKRVRERNEQGQWAYTSYVYDEPWLENPATDKPRSDNPATDKPSTGKPAADNRAIISTVVTNTDQTNTVGTSTEEQTASSDDDATAPAPVPPDGDCLEAEASSNFDAVYGAPPPEVDFGMNGSAPRPEPPPTPEPQAITEQQAMFGALCEATGADPNTLTQKKRGQIAQTGKKLREAGYVAEDVGTFMITIWFKDWRWCKYGELPRLDQIQDEIGKIRAGVPVDLPKRQTQGGNAVDAFFDRLEQQGVYPQ